MEEPLLAETDLDAIALDQAADDKCSDEEDFDIPDDLFGAWGQIAADDDSEPIAEAEAVPPAAEPLIIPPEAKVALPLFQHVQSVAESLPPELFAAYKESALCATLTEIITRLSAIA